MRQDSHLISHIGYPYIWGAVHKLIRGLLLFGSMPLFPQTTRPNMEVLIRDGDGRPISGVAVKIAQGPRTIKGGETDEHGRISFPNLETGRYDLAARKIGYQALEKHDLKRHYEDRKAVPPGRLSIPFRKPNSDLTEGREGQRLHSL
jgi:hypothetical protein